MQNEGTVIISFSKILDMAARTLKPIRKTEEIDLFLRYQHEIGNLIYFSDIPDYIILDPQWLANAFSAIVTAKKFQLELLGYDEWDAFQRTGMLKTGLLNAIFTKQPKNIQYYKDHVIMVMEKFDIIIRPKTATGEDRSKEERHYFVPCMIKTAALSNIDVLCKVPIGGKTSCLCFVFNFLPRAFINHLIVSYIRTFTTSKVRDTMDNRKQPSLFHELGVFDISNTGCEKLLVAVYQNTVQIQIWKYGKIKHRVYSDVENFISGEIKRIQCEKYRMVNMTHSKQFKCHDTKYDNFEGLKNCHIYQNGQEYQCEEHDAVHEFIDDWFEVQQISDGQKRKESGVTKEEKQRNELASRRLFECLEDNKTKRRKEKRGDVMKLKDTEELHAQSQHKQPAYKFRLQKNFKNIVSTITHETIIDHLISEEVFSFDDYQIIDSCPGQTQKNRRLDHLLLSRGDRGYSEFIKALRLDSAYMDLADIIEDTRVV
ncbi:uncharacterized protein LOC127730016 [Mytilus californianus]|uniref:uncharacterized protein LOC127730016 n=1 Tax=Mytilus californianus TaxID=6549 RepID=UPI002245C4CE|nr:uncharacterized protein LOC127730016 [Mytilus californianus]